VIREEFKEIIQLIFQEVNAYYGEILTSFVVFGSCRRGTPNPDSDIDILIVLKNAALGRIKRMKEFYDNVEKKIEPYLEKLREYGINTFLSPIIRSEEEVMMGSPLYIEMTVGVKVYFDRDDFFRKYLISLEKKLKELGAEKKEGSYWIYKKDVNKEGGVEVF